MKTPQHFTAQAEAEDAVNIVPDDHPPANWRAVLAFSFITVVAIVTVISYATQIDTWGI